MSELDKIWLTMIIEMEICTMYAFNLKQICASTKMKHDGGNVYVFPNISTVLFNVLLL